METWFDLSACQYDLPIIEDCKYRYKFLKVKCKGFYMGRWKSSEVYRTLCNKYFVYYFDVIVK